MPSKWAMRLIRAGILCLFIVLQGCSYFTDFAVVNLSTAPIEVTYRTQSSSSPPRTPYPRPATVEARKLRPRGTRWAELSATGYHWSADSSEVTVTLAPHTALRFASLTNWSESASDPKTEWIPNLRVQMTGSPEAQQYSRQDVIAPSNKRSMHLYVLTVTAEVYRASTPSRAHQAAWPLTTD
jgi:hypothetical protein